MEEPVNSSDHLLPEDVIEIPQKLYFRIGEVSELVGVESYVLRYWESEFPSLSPKRTGSKQRLYRRKDVQQLLRIKHLLYDRKFTIQGARQALRELPRAEKAAVKPRVERQAELFAIDPLPEVRKALEEILAMLR
jgi:DNA-binding transcriptional MerR regulator